MPRRSEHRSGASTAPWGTGPRCTLCWLPFFRLLLNRQQQKHYLKPAFARYISLKTPICRTQKRTKQSARPRHTEGSSKQERQRSRLCQRRQAFSLHYPTHSAPTPSLYQLVCRAIHSLCYRSPTHRDRSLGLLIPKRKSQEMPSAAPRI